MSFGGFIITNNGRNELARAQNGGTLSFSKVVLGSGKHTGSFSDITSVVNPVVELVIGKVYVESSKCIIECDFSNDSIQSGFYLKEIGIYANGILYCYDNAGDDAEYIYPAGSAVVKQKRLRFILNISSTTNVSLVAGSGLYTTYQEFEELRTSVGVLTSLTTGIKTSIVSAINWMVEQLNLKAPKSHASTGTTYGIGTEASYGHAKTINNLVATQYKDGEALSAYQGKVLKDGVDTLNRDIDYLDQRLNNFTSFTIIQSVADTVIGANTFNNTNKYIYTPPDGYKVIGVELMHSGSDNVLTFGTWWYVSNETENQYTITFNLRNIAGYQLTIKPQFRVTISKDI